MRPSPFVLCSLRRAGAAVRSRVAVLATCAIAALLAGAGSVPAQTASPLHATRAQIESLATVTEQQASSARKKDEQRRKRDEAGRLRERLRQGDFQVGDQIVLEVQNEPTLSDTFTVRAGRQILLPNISPISVDGVLRSELTQHLTQELARYLRNPIVRSTALIRMEVAGEVNRPGFYAVPSDVLVSDAIMIAGGPTSDGDLKKIVIRRGDQEVLDESATQNAIRAGQTLDQLNLRAGDGVVVGELRRFSFSTGVQIAATVATLIIGIVAATR